MDVAVAWRVRLETSVHANRRHRSCAELLDSLDWHRERPVSDEYTFLSSGSYFTGLWMMVRMSPARTPLAPAVGVSLQVADGIIAVGFQGLPSIIGKLRCQGPGLTPAVIVQRTPLNLEKIE